MEQNSGNQQQINGTVDTSLRLGLPQFHRNHQDLLPQTGRVCVQCGCDRANTPTWRRGPEGPGTLCNACGLRYMRRQKTGNDAGAA